MRIRSYRPGDIPILVHIQQAAATFDGLEPMSEADLARLLERSITRGGYNVFLLADDDDELNTWGQGDTLDGLQGEVVGYTILQLCKGERAYRFRCHGAVLPEHRGRGGGHGLILCALNHARMQSIDFIAEARQHDIPVYFEVPLLTGDVASECLARDLELEKSGEQAQTRLSLYQTEL